MRNRLPMVFSFTALLVALFGITPLGEAAYNAVVPRNSVGTLQLQRNAVKSAVVLVMPEPVHAPPLRAAATCGATAL